MSSEHSLNEEPIRSGRMTPEEARAVIGLWQQGQSERLGMIDLPSVPDVAEGLDITVEEVHRLLEEVRAAREERERGVVQEQERLEQELAQLAEERARLAQTESTLLELHIKRSEVYSQRPRYEARARPRPTYFPKRRPHKTRAHDPASPAPIRLLDTLVVWVSTLFGFGLTILLLWSVLMSLVHTILTP